MFAVMSPLCLWICVVVITCSQRHVSAEQKTITAESGQNVTLPCRAPNNNILGVDWSRADLEEEYVLLYRDGHFDSANQHPSFKDRVDLQDRQMKDGDVSLILKNVTITDTGTYECRLQQSGTNRRKRAVYDNDPISIIYLSVVAPPEKEVIQVNVTVGENVILPCKAPNNNSITVVELSRPDLDPECVFLYRDEWIDADSQNSRFKDRVELQDRHMKDGDVSVILKNVALNDTGTYECRVVQTTTNRRKRGVDPISIIYLRVAPPGPTGGPGRLRGGLSVSALLLVAAVGFILIYRKHKQQQSHGLYQPRAEL